jgi:hypothetical protein
MEIRGPVLLPARREEIELRTLDGLTLVGELALPEHRDPVATLVTLHPLPTAGGFMDSHILRKAAAPACPRRPRRPALQHARHDIAPRHERGRLRRRTRRGVRRRRGDGVRRERALPHPWLVGWSFGTELALKYGRDHDDRRRHPARRRCIARRRKRSPRGRGRPPHGRRRARSSTTTCARPRRASVSRACHARSSRSTAASTSGWGDADAPRAHGDRRGRQPDALPLPTEWDACTRHLSF